MATPAHNCVVNAAEPTQFARSARNSGFRWQQITPMQLPVLRPRLLALRLFHIVEASRIQFLCGFGDEISPGVRLNDRKVPPVVQTAKVNDGCGAGTVSIVVRGKSARHRAGSNRLRPESRHCQLGPARQVPYSSYGKTRFAARIGSDRLTPKPGASLSSICRLPAS